MYSSPAFIGMIINSLRLSTSLKNKINCFKKAIQHVPHAYDVDICRLNPCPKEGEVSAVMMAICYSDCIIVCIACNAHIWY